MKTTYFLGFIALCSLTIWGCNNSQVTPEDSTLSAASARLTGDTTGFHCRKTITKIAITDLPAAITSAISASYAGATVDYAAKDDAGNFLVAITQNDARKTLLFNADGTFNKELALHDGPGGKGPGGHGPGGFGHSRDSLSQVAVTSLPAAITSYITANYAGSTINAAGKDATRGYIVMVTLADGTRKALLFNIDGTFAQDVVRGVKGNYSVVAVSALPTAITTYISTNYAGATVKLAGKNPTGQYKVFVQLSTGQLAELTFAADGTFVQLRKGR